MLGRVKKVISDGKVISTWIYYTLYTKEEIFKDSGVTVNSP